MLIYTVNVLGWGDCEDVYYNCGTFNSLAKAKAHAAKLLAEWQNSGGNAANFNFKIERLTVA